MDKKQLVLPTPPKIQVTYDYGKFKKLDGNRVVLEKRVKKLTESVEAIGYVPIPIVVNEKFEIIEGQGRFETLKRKEMPIYYIVVPGLTIEHCIYLNINNSNWTLRDYIKSYADQGNQSYIVFLRLLQAHPDIKLSVVGAAATTKVGGPPNEEIQNGNLKLLPGAADLANEILTWLEINFLPFNDYIKGNAVNFYCALVFCYKQSNCNKKTLVEAIRSNKMDLPPFGNIQHCLEVIEKLYNKKTRKEKVYLKRDYDMFLTSSVQGYEKRWGKLSVRVRKEQAAYDNA